MKFHLQCSLALFAASAQGFTTPSNSRSDVFLNRNSLLVRHSTALQVENSWKDVTAFNIALDKIAEQCGNSKHPVISKAAECQEMWEDLSKADAEIKPDTISLNTVLKAWNRCCGTLSESVRTRKSIPNDFKRSVDVYTPRDAATRATSLLLGQEDLLTDVGSYNIVIDTWAKSRVPDAPEAAERLLKRLLDSDSLEPDTYSYNGVVDAWANSGREDGLEKVMQIFHHMEGLHNDGKDIKPSIRTVNAILNAHAKLAMKYTSPARYQDKEFDKATICAAGAQKLLDEIKLKYEETGDPDWRPDVTTYTVLMDVYSRCGSYDATKKAEKLLVELKEEYEKTKDSRLRPNYRTYTTLITAWSRTRSPESPARVEALLAEMSNDPATKPNSRAYTSAIQCWAKSRDPQKAKRVLKILLDMKESAKTSGNKDILPTILTYNTAIDACARVRGEMDEQMEALKIAFAIFKSAEADATVEVNEVTYSTVLKAVGFLLPLGAERNKVASVIFEKAKKAGAVEFATVKNLRKCVDHEIMLQLMEGVADKNGNFDYGDIPASWNRNVK
eukprot:scaffold1869_cov122-Cylindrotheca_fusiformis.AAC.41